MNKGRITNLSLLLIIASGTLHSQTIHVDAGNDVKTFDHHPVGINVCYLMDDDAYLQPEIPIVQSINAMGVGMLRYPGGEKSDNYLWSVPPYDTANPHFATQGNCNWPNGDKRFSSNALSPLPYTLDFDEFIKLCKATGTEPLIVVSGDAHLCDLCPSAPTLDTLIRNAVEWVKYANVIHGYDIKYWVVGNESHHSSAYGRPGTASGYANDFIQFARAMKAVDSSICVMGNTREGEWVNKLLNMAGDYVDALAMSNYPIWDWQEGYEMYRTGNPSFTGSVQSVISSIGNREIDLIITEYAPIDWATSWPADNDLGHALVSFQMFGDMISMPGVLDAYLWNTRWVDNPTSPQQVYDAIDKDGNLNATGKALSIWGKYLLDKLVHSDNDGYIRSFASVDSAGERMNIFLINKDSHTQNAEVIVDNWPVMGSPNLVHSEVYLSGNSDMDKFPDISLPEAPAEINGSSLLVQLKPLSVHVLQLYVDPLSGSENTTVPVPGLRVYPNPVTDILHIEFPGPPTDKVQLRIYNCTGSLVLSEELMSQYAEFNLKAIPAGVYILSLDHQNVLLLKKP